LWPMAASAEIVVGVNLSLTGPAAGLGTSFQRGLSFAPTEIAGEAVRYIILDDGTDPSAAVRNVRKLASEENVDILMGPTNAPAGYAIAPVLAELEVPLLCATPVELYDDNAHWFGTTLMDNPSWIGPIVDDMAANGAKRIAYIGYSDTYGDIIYDNLVPLATEAGMEVITNERFARSDTSVTGQVLKIIAADPDAIFVGASTSPAALPNNTLLERGYTKPIYNTPVVVGDAFVRLMSKDTPNVFASSFLISAAPMLPEDHLVKSISMEFIEKYRAKFDRDLPDGQESEGYDAGIILERIASEALKSAKPGTQEFRLALRDELYKIKDMVGTMGIYTFNQGNPYGLDERSITLLKLTNGEWELKD
jgi:branched-chain amino acid transport system substrate-binding protein